MVLGMDRLLLFITDYRDMTAGPLAGATLVTADFVEFLPAVVASYLSYASFCRGRSLRMCGFRSSRQKEASGPKAALLVSPGVMLSSNVTPIIVALV